MSPFHVTVQFLFALTYTVSPTFKRPSLSGDSLLSVPSLARLNVSDKNAPIITETIQPSKNHRKVTVTLKADKEVIFRENGKQGTEFTRVINANGEYVYHFADAELFR